MLPVAGTSAPSRLTAGTNYVNMEGSVISTGTNIFSTSRQNSYNPNFNEFGVTGGYAWIGSYSGGAIATGYTCTDWTDATNGVTGYIGYPGDAMIFSGWQAYACDSSIAILCFEQ